MKMFLLLLVTLIGLAWVAYSVIDLAIDWSTVPLALTQFLPACSARSASP